MNSVKKNLKYFIAALLVAAVFTAALNSLEKNLEHYFLTREMDRQFTAQLVESEPRSFNPKSFDLSIDARAAASVWTDLKGDERILYQKNFDQSVPIASLSKLMTTLVVVDLNGTYDLDQGINITKKAIEQNGITEEKELKPGNRMKAKELLAMSLIESSNDAAYALTHPVGEQAFVSLMNLYAEKLDLNQTQFHNPTGLEEEQHSNQASPRDLIKLSEYILSNHPTIFELSSRNSYRVLNPSGSVHHRIDENTNSLVEEVSNLVGGKTGYTEEARECLLVVLENEDGPGYFINVILGSDDRFGEMKKIIDQIQ